jgi:hypothetical protein
MGRLFGIRSAIALIVLLAVAGGIYAMRDRMASLSPAPQPRDAVEDERDWRQRELMFLKQAYDRLEAQRLADGGDAATWVRGEQQAIQQRMAETAAPIRDDIGPEIRAMLPGAPPTLPEPTKSELAKSELAKSEPAKSEPPKSEPAKSEPAKSEPVSAAAPAPPPQPAELRLSSARLPGIGTDLKELTPDPELDRIWALVRTLRARQPKPAEAAPKPAAETATKPAAETPKPAASETSGSAKQ